jgi:hypothetical protein
MAHLGLAITSPRYAVTAATDDALPAGQVPSQVHALRPDALPLALGAEPGRARRWQRARAR